jgi:hypothetical protein
MRECKDLCIPRTQLAAASSGATPTLLQAAERGTARATRRSTGQHAELEQAREWLNWSWSSIIAAAHELWYGPARGQEQQRAALLQRSSTLC